MSAIFRSECSTPERAYRALVKTPVEFVVGTYKTPDRRAFDVTISPRFAANGQILFAAQRAGWPGGGESADQRMMIARRISSSRP